MFSNYNKNAIFRGYAIIFNIKDSYNDVITNSAFKNSLLKGIKNIPLLWQHNQDKQIGYFNNIIEDFVGLYVEGVIENINKENKEIYSFIKNNIVNGLSIGYTVNDFKIDKKNRRVLTNINLKEISIVSFPANKLSSITYCE